MQLIDKAVLMCYYDNKKNSEGKQMSYELSEDNRRMIEAYIKKQKEKQEYIDPKEYENEKNEFLKEAGLCRKFYCNDMSVTQETSEFPYAEWNAKLQRRVFFKIAPINISDEEYEKILKATGADKRVNVPKSFSEIITPDEEENELDKTIKRANIVFDALACVLLIGFFAFMISALSSEILGDGLLGLLAVAYVICAGFILSIAALIKGVLVSNVTTAKYTKRVADIELYKLNKEEKRK